MFHPTLKEPFLFLVLKSFLAFLTLFNFQGTCRLATVFITYHKSFRLSTTFFRFFNLFCRCRFPLRDSSSILPQSIPLVNKFFRFSQNFFLATASLSRQLCYINTLTTICQTFFRPFFRFFRRFGERDKGRGKFYHGLC